MTWERYTDDYGPRVALSFPYDNNAKDALKGELGFPAVKWDGVKKAWSVRDKRDTWGVQLPFRWIGDARICDF